MKWQKFKVPEESKVFPNPKKGEVIAIHGSRFEIVKHPMEAKGVFCSLCGARFFDLEEYRDHHFKVHKCSDF